MCHPRFGFDSPIATSSSGFRYGNGRSSSARTQLKIVALTPMPSARQSTAAMVNAGFLISVRNGEADVLEHRGPGSEPFQFDNRPPASV